MGLNIEHRTVNVEVQRQDMRSTEVTLSLPKWAERVVNEGPMSFPGVEDRMQFVMGLSELNISHGTGGPFGAAIFDAGTGRLVSAGVNLVVASRCSVAHAEIVAIILAQKILGSHDLSAEGMPLCELVSSAEPCAMCLGAIPWSGVRRLVCGARREDAEEIGFDEGYRPPDWVAELEKRGIAVCLDVCREKAAGILRRYRDAGGVLYNSAGGVGKEQPIFGWKGANK